MKIQLITQSIKPIRLNTETNSNPILKNTFSDSFERQSNVTFKGSAADVAGAVADEAFKSKVLASIAKKGEEGLDALCTDLPTLRQTLTVLNDFLTDHSENFDTIIDKKCSFPTREDAINALVEHHNLLDNAVDFWTTLNLNEKAKTLMQNLQISVDDYDKFLSPVYNSVDNAKKCILMPKYSHSDFTVKKWVESLFDLFR